MKLFKHNTKRSHGVKLTKKYLRMAATYRRFSDRNNLYWDFPLDSLIECFNYESHGMPYTKNNGYVNGKWMKDINVSMWAEDVKNGYFAKIKFYTPLNKWFAVPVLADIIAPTFFPYENVKINHKGI